MKKDDGAIMLEGMLVTIITMIMLIWILGVGFIYYQRYLVTIVTNDAAAKISSVYYNTDCDIVMGYVETESLPLRNLYRDLGGGALQDVNQSRAQAYIEHNLTKMNFSGVMDDVSVQLDFVSDSILRKHIEVTTTATFKTPFLSQLNLGMNGNVTYQITSRSDCTDISGYITNVDFMNSQLSMSAANSTVVKIINSIIKFYNHVVN